MMTCLGVSNTENFEGGLAKIAMKSGVNYGDVVSPDQDERLQALEDIRHALKSVIEAVNDGVNVSDYEYLVDQCEDWLDECENDIKAVQDEIDEQLDKAPSHDYDE